MIVSPFNRFSRGTSSFSLLSCFDSLFLWFRCRWVRILLGSSPVGLILAPWAIRRLDRPSVKTTARRSSRGRSRQNLATRWKMGRINLDAIPNYSRKYKEKRAVSETPQPSLSEGQQIAEATRRSLLDQVGRRVFEPGCSNPTGMASEKTREEVEVVVPSEMRGDGQVARRELVLGLQNSSGTFGARRVAPEVGRADASKRPRVSDHRWGFRYDDMAAPFTSNSVACAELLREIGRGSGIPSMPLDLKEEKVFAGAARKSIEAIAEWDRLTYLYERCVRSLSVDATNAKDAHEALAVEKEKVAQALADLARSQDDAKEMKRKYDELAGRALSEMKRLRERRLEYAEFVRRSALDKMAELVQKRLDRIKAHIDDTKAAEPKFLEFNQVSGNIKTLEALVEGGEVEMKSDDMMLRLVADAEELEAEVKAFGITDLMDGDFDVRTLFAELSPDNRNSVPPPTEGEDLADGRGECEGQAGERIVGQTEVRDEIADARD